MSIRLHQLAKELGTTSKALIEKLAKLGVKVKGHMSALDSETAEIVRHELGNKGQVTKDERRKTKEEGKIREDKGKEKGKKEGKAGAVRDDKEKEGKVEGDKRETTLKALEVELPVTVKQLALKLNVNTSELIKKLMKKNIFANINQNIPNEIVSLFAEEYGYEIKKPPTMEEELLKEHKDTESSEDKKGKVIRAPIVTFMGHVDHGKTSLLDFIRKARVAAKEKGGITQHIGAYEVCMGKKGKITFLDTPGHEAFTAMRARGANATDIVVLVVAADDGIMPQTIEAIDHAKAAGVPIVVAINKCDLPNISLDKIKKQLAGHALLAEDWDGKTITVPVSAKTGQGVDKLLEMLLLEAELLELKSNPELRARGVVIEGKLSAGQGPVATILVKNGTLRTGDVILSGLYYGRVKAMISDTGQRLKEAPPSTPVEILGLAGVPEAGDEFFSVKDEKKARTLSLLKQDEKRLTKLGSSQRMSLEDLYKRIQDGTVKELKVIIKGDVQGSVEALKESLEALANKEVGLKVIHMGAGSINESDTMLALVSNAIIIGFHTKLEEKAEAIAKNEGLEIKMYNIIYEAVADIKAALEGLLEPIIKEMFVARAKVLQVFNITKTGNIAGCQIVKGLMPRSGSVKVIRNKEVVFKGRIRSLKHHKDDIKEAREGLECGIAIQGYDKVRAGDLIESYKEEKIIRRLEKSK